MNTASRFSVLNPDIDLDNAFQRKQNNNKEKVNEEKASQSEQKKNKSSNRKSKNKSEDASVSITLQS